MDNEKNRKHELQQEKNTDSFSNFLIAIRVTSSKTCKVSKCAISAAASSGVQTLGFGFTPTKFTGLAGNPKNGGFKDDFPFQTGDFPGLCDLQGLTGCKNSHLHLYTPDKSKHDWLPCFGVLPRRPGLKFHSDLVFSSPKRPDFNMASEVANK